MTYLRGLDGLRAVAVLAVMAYHADVAGFRGGYLGVEVFFVISGFLITRLLLTEWDYTGRVDLLRFWRRRIRRLLPALVALLIGVIPLTVVFAPDIVDDLRVEILAALVYATNWFLIASDQSYFESFARPSPLRHLWSLAVEEQFYVVWPLVTAGAFRIGGRRLALQLAGVGAIASAAWAWWLAGDIAGADPSRLYYGADTRASGLLIGAALALSGQVIRRHQWLWAAGSGSALVLGTMGLSGTDPMLFRGGLIAVGLASATLIAIIAAPASSLDRLLGVGPLAAIGQRSYSLYLWHWPVIIVTRPRLDTTLEGFRLHLIQFALSFILAEISYRLVEEPIRRQGFTVRSARRRMWSATQASAFFDTRRRLVGRAMVAGLALGTVVVSLQQVQDPVLLAAGGRSSEIELASPPDSLVVPPPTASPADTPSSTTPSSTAQPPTSPPGDNLTPSSPPPSSDPPPHPPAGGPPPGTPPDSDPTTGVQRPPRVVALGDSVMLGAAPELETALPAIVIDAETSRSVWELGDASRAALDEADAIIIHLGQNGTPSSAMVDGLLDSFDPDLPVVLVTVRAPVRWEDASNRALTEAIARWPNATLADWRSLANDEWGWFVRDGVHLTSEGRAAYAAFVLEAARRVTSGSLPDAAT